MQLASRSLKTVFQARCTASVAPRFVPGRRAFESRPGVTVNASTERQIVEAFLFARLPASTCGSCKSLQADAIVPHLDELLVNA